MYWRFTISSVNGDEVIDEPIGWDTAVIDIKRDPVWKGIFMEYTLDLQFPNEGYFAIKTLYDQYGTEAQADLIIEWHCDEESPFEEVYIGALNFTKVVFSEGSECIAAIGLEKTGCQMVFNNLYDQQVDLDAVKSFDGTTDLTPYNNLGVIIDLPSKTILKHNTFIRANDNTENNTTIVPDTTGHFFQTKWKFGWDNEVFSEFGVVDDTFINEDSTGVTPPDDFNDIPALLICDENGLYDIDMKLSFSLHITTSPSFLDGAQNQFQVIVGITKNGSTTIDTIDVIFNSETVTIPITDPDHFDYTISANNLAFSTSINLEQGDEIRIYALSGTGTSIESVSNTSIFQDLTMPLDADPSNPDSEEVHNYFRAILKSTFKPTPSKIYLINEALSRTAEAITDDCLRVYSDYFGRTDAQPYISNSDGCGSLECITEGLIIRNVPPQVDSNGNIMPRITASFKELFDGLNAIHNIGLGIEFDPHRVGKQLIRIEQIEYFFNDTVVLTCDKITDIKRAISTGNYFNQFNFGYNKWEAEEFSGLDEFATQRTYRNNITSSQAKLSQLSNLIASGYAIEVTRRLQYDTNPTQDWRYDNDKFIICLVNYFTVNFGTAHTFNFPEDVTQTEGLSVGDVVTFVGAGGNDVITFNITSVTPGAGVGFAETVADFGGFTNVKVTVNSILKKIVEQNNIDSPYNLVDPPTVYNFRISPVRNMLRWMKTIMQSYYKATDSTSILTFTDGTGNFTAAGIVNNGCTLEGTAQPLGESQTLSIDDVFDLPANAIPIYYNEEISFDFPLSVVDYKAIMANPNGIIRIRWGQNTGFLNCYISEIQYRPDSGDATFKLLPKVEYVCTEGIGCMIIEQTFIVG